ncbi:MAG: hypothetical protein ACRDQ5_02995 [Sciscionella sp.]
MTTATATPPRRTPKNYAGTSPITRASGRKKIEPLISLDPAFDDPMLPRMRRAFDRDHQQVGVGRAGCAGVHEWHPVGGDEVVWGLAWPGERAPSRRLLWATVTRGIVQPDRGGDNLKRCSCKICRVSAG